VVRRADFDGVAAAADDDDAIDEAFSTFFHEPSLSTLARQTMHLSGREWSAMAD